MLSIKHLNTDASFLLTFEPLGPTSPHPLPIEARPYHVLLDPWIVGSSKIFHSKISLTKHKEPACVTSLRELPEPDLVVISQSKSDHCNEATLKQIPPSSKTIILAEPAAARVIQGWKHFDRRKVRTLKRWDESHTRGGGKGHYAVTRLPLPPTVPGGEHGEVTVAFIPQRRDLTGLHAAIGITFRSSPRKVTRAVAARTAKPCTIPPCVTFPITPPTTPKSHRSYPNLPALYIAAGHHSPTPACPPLPLIHSRELANQPPPSAEDASAPPPPFAPQSPTATIRSARSCSTLTPTNTISSTLSAAATLTNQTVSSNSNSILTTVPPRSAADRTLSVIFSPHGIPFAGNLESYATTHLVNEAALPLTALLHCFDHVRNPWWLGGNVLLGAPSGANIAVRLGARCWVSCHDGDKDVQGLATGWVKTRRWDRDTLERAVTGDGMDAIDVFCPTKGQEQEREKGDSLLPLPPPAGEKLELRRVGSKLRLWPITPSSSSKDCTEGPPERQGRDEASPAEGNSISSSPLTTTTIATAAGASGKAKNNKGTQIIDLASGEVVVLTSEGPWDVFRG